MVSPWERASSGLLQNSDLPPPLKLFSPFLKDGRKTTPKTTTTMTTVLDEDGLENSQLLKALRLSQTRAREAEKKAAEAGTRSEQMGVLLLEESLRLSAHRQWVRLLEMEILLLRAENKRRGSVSDCEREDDADEEDDVAALSWCFTLALCLGIGFVLSLCMF